MDYTRKSEINGYSNEYWGWGGEDDDLSNRVRTYYNLTTVPRPYNNMEDYHAIQIQHGRDNGNSINPERLELLKQWKTRWWHDGINVSKSL